MNLLIPTIGTRGDVQPFIALAQGLSNAGHSVTLASHPVMRALVEAHGVTFAPIGPDIDLGEEVAEMRRRSRNSMVGLIRSMRFSFDILERSHDDILELCHSTDLVVVPSQCAAGKNEADLLKLPTVSVNFVPWGIPYDDPRRPVFKRLLYKAIDGLVSLVSTIPLNRMRKRQGLLPVGAEGFNSTRLNLVPISPLVYTPNPLWSAQHQVVGYWFADPPRGWQPSLGLMAFLENGAPPLVISLGAMSLGSDDAPEIARLFVDAVSQAGVRAIIQGWEPALAQLHLPPSVYAAGSLPHSWLLPRCRGIVHHGGFGTTSAGLRAGIPALVIPHMVDQFYWAQRVNELGVGLPPVRRHQLEVKGLAAAIYSLAHDAELHNSAAILGAKIRHERGIENAVRLIEETYNSTGN